MFLEVIVNKALKKLFFACACAYLLFNDRVGRGQQWVAEFFLLLLFEPQY